MIRAWRHGGGKALALVEGELPEPELEDDEVVIAVEAVAVGRIDVERALAGGPVPGGAGVGTAVAAAEGGAHLIGARVAFGPALPCGECGVCRRGAAGVCPRGRALGRDVDGALAERVVARARWLCRLDEGLELPGPGAALIGREAADAYALYTRAGVAPGEPVVIVGADATAALLAQLAATRGSKVVRVAEPGAGAADRARADAAAAQLGDRPWRVFSTAASPESLAVADELAGPGATLGVLARAPAAAPLDLAALAAREVTVVGVAAAHPDLLTEVAALAVEGELDLDAAAEVVALDAALPDLGARVDAAEHGGRAVVVTLPG